jgi:hypothetical protein
MISIQFPEVNMFTWEDDSSVWILETAARVENTERRYPTHVQVSYFILKL